LNEDHLSCPFDCSKEDNNDSEIKLSYLIYFIVAIIIVLGAGILYITYRSLVERSILSYLNGYIKDAKSNGFTDLHIRHKLLSSGYDKNIVDKALKQKH
jgi:hypothetical protein